MGSESDKSPLIVLVGETASGKTELSLALAEQFNAEVIAADSRTLYKGMDIGTAKPTPEQQHIVRHHILDVVEPDHPLSAADFKALAVAAIDDITSRGGVPLLVGGTGLYVDAILFDYTFANMPSPAERERLQKLSVDELQALHKQRNIPLPQNSRNPRHLVRQLETNGRLGRRAALRANTLVLGIQTEHDQLTARIEQRADSMLAAGLEQEVRGLVTQYGWCRPLETIGYQEFRPYFEGQCSIQNVRSMIVRNSLQYAKRQRTWFRRNKHIHWICKKDEAVDLVTTYLNK